jgi:cytochrome c biogenesis protein CcmG/thiol:disulfide interchange protein DsbE
MAWVVAVFAALVVLLAVGLTLNPDKKFSHQEMRGKVWILNVWASWCAPCLVEHPVVSALAKSGLAPVVGLNYKDAREDALPWLKRNGDPYQFSVFDATGRIGIDYGVYGVPETYVIDRRGVIRYKRIGPLTPEISRDKVQPLLQELSRES